MPPCRFAQRGETLSCTAPTSRSSLVGACAHVIGWPRLVEGEDMNRASASRALWSTLQAVFAASLTACGGGGGGTATSAPMITAQPQAQTVTTGSTATFNVVASGTGLAYQWYRGGTAVPGAN